MVERQTCPEVFRDRPLICDEVAVTEPVEPLLDGFGRVRHVEFGLGHSEH